MSRTGVFGLLLAVSIFGWLRVGNRIYLHVWTVPLNIVILPVYSDFTQGGVIHLSIRRDFITDIY